MISIAGLLTPTQIIGLTSSLFALVPCAAEWVRGGFAPDRRRLAAILTMLEAALFLDTVFRGRLHLHDLLVNVAMANNVYGERFGPQYVALVLLGCAVALGVAVAFRRYRCQPGASLAILGGILSAYCWCVEVISLHAVDSFLHQRVNGVMLVRLASAAFSLMTGIGILWDSFVLPAHVLDVEA